MQYPGITEVAPGEMTYNSVTEIAAYGSQLGIQEERVDINSNQTKFIKEYRNSTLMQE